MKWSFLAGLLTSAAILSPLSVSAKAEMLSSESLIVSRFLSKSSIASALGIKTKEGGESQQTAQSEMQGKVPTMDNLGRGGNEGSKPKSPDALQLSRGLGSGGGEGGGTPSQHTSAVNIKDNVLPGRPMLAAKDSIISSTPVDGERGPSLGSRSGDGSFTMPTPVSITVGQKFQGEEGPSIHSSRGAQARSQTQDISSPSQGGVSEGSLNEPAPSSGGSMSGGGGGRASASEEGVVLPSDVVKEYQQLKAEKAQGKIPVPPPVSSQELERVAKMGRIPHAEGKISSEALEQAKMNLKKVKQATVPAQTKESSSKEASSKTVASSSKPESVVTSPAEKQAQKPVSVSTTGTSKGSGATLSFGGTSIAENIFRAAEVLGFDLNASFKGEPEALDELRKKASGKATANDNALEKLYTAIGEKQPTEKQIEEITRLAKENESLDQYKKTLTEFLKKKYDKSQVDPTEKDMEAAQLIGFNLNAAYKSEAEALDELRKKASGKTTANDNALEKLYSAIGAKQPTEKQIEEITRLAKENDSLDLYKKTLTEFLKKKYAVAKKGPRVIDVAGGDWKEQIANLGTASGPGGKKTVKKAPTLKELGVDLDKTTKALREAEEEYESLRLTDVEDSTLKAVSKKIEKLKEEKVTKVFAYDKKREQEQSAATTTAKPSSVVKVDPLKAAREQEALRVVKENNPTLGSEMDILSPADQIKLLTRKMTLFYNAKDNKHIPERITSLGKVVQGATVERTEYVINVLKALSPTQRDSLREYLQGLEMGARLSALSYVPNYLGIAKYKFPDLEKPVPSTATPSKKPVAKVKLEEIVSSPKVVPTVSTPEKKMTLKERLELLGDKKLTGGSKLPLKGSGPKDEND